MTTAYATKSHTYRGYRIEPCEWADNPHGGRWAIRTTHQPSGLDWSDEHCTHAYTLTAAREMIDQWVADEA
jgi:hypothetical protein